MDIVKRHPKEIGCTIEDVSLKEPEFWLKNNGQVNDLKKRCVRGNPQKIYLIFFVFIYVYFVRHE